MGSSETRVSVLWEKLMSKYAKRGRVVSGNTLNACRRLSEPIGVTSWSLRSSIRVKSISMKVEFSEVASNSSAFISFRSWDEMVKFT